MDLAALLVTLKEKKKKKNSYNLINDSNLENMLGCNDFLPLEDDSVDKLTHDDGTSSPFLPASLIYVHAC
jgi:hypothetical protein